MDNQTITTGLVVLVVLVVAWLAIGMSKSNKISPSEKRTWKNHMLILPFKVLGGFAYPVIFLFLFNIPLVIMELTSSSFDGPLAVILFVLYILVGMGAVALIQSNLDE